MRRAIQRVLKRPTVRLACLILSVLAAPAADALASTLSADFTDFTTSQARRNLALYKLSEAVNVQFSATGVTAGQTLTVTIKDVHDTTVFTQNYTVNTSPNWSTTIPGYSTKLGFYRVYGSLNDGTQVASVGSRPPGFVTYCVLPDPTQRAASVPDTQAFFGMQGGYYLASSGSGPGVGTDGLAFLGIRWLMDGGWVWRDLSPAYNDKYVAGNGRTPGRVDASTTNGAGGSWAVYGVPTLTKDGRPYGGNPDVYIPGTFAYNTGALLDAYKPDFSDFCTQVARAWPTVNTNRTQAMYEITWEPIPTWGYGGTPAQLVTLHQLAYNAIHAENPNAWVVGPTMGTYGSDILDDFNAGLGSYIDAFSAHPYMYSDTGDWYGCQNEPEKLGQPVMMRDMKRKLRGYMGRDIPMMGHEQGYPTYNCQYNTSTGALTFASGIPNNELAMARRLIRSNLLVMGEGWIHNVAFSWGDYPQGIGGLGSFWDYGFFYNLDIGSYNPSNGSWSGSYGGYGAAKVQPKPVVAAYAAMSFLLEGRKSVCDINWLRDTTRGYAFQKYSDSNDVVLALWDFSGTGQSTTINVGTGVSSVDVYDWMGNKTTVSTPGGAFTYTLTNEPIYVKGVAASAWGSARPNNVVSTGKSVSVSSSADATNYPAANAVDGDSVADLSRWLSTSNSSVAHWIYVDLGTSTSINEVRFWTGQYYQAIQASQYNAPIPSYQIQTSPNASTWTTVVNRTGNTKAVVDETFTATSARYVRLYVPAGSIAQVMLYEFQVLGQGQVSGSITVTNPTASTNYQAGGWFPLTWTSTGTVGNVNVDQSTDNGTTWARLVSNIANSGSYGIYLSATPSTNCYIRVQDVSGSPTGISEKFVTYGQVQATITVTNPTASTNYPAGGWFPLSWTSTGSVGNVDVDQSLDDGSTWTRLVSNIANSGSYGIYLLATPSTNCRIRVRDVSGAPAGISEKFTTYGQTPASITVTNPTASTNYPAGGWFPLSWTSTGTVGNVDVDQSTDNGTTWVRLVSNIANSGSYGIYLSATPSTNCYIRIRDVSGSPTGTSAKFTTY